MIGGISNGYPSEKLDDKILRKYVLQYIDDIFVEFGEQPSIHLISINIDDQYFSINFNIFQYIFNIFQYYFLYFTINTCYIISKKKYIFFFLHFLNILPRMIIPQYFSISINTSIHAT
jgi:hypothetical protein